MNSANLELAITLVPKELWNTLYMVFVSAIIAVIIGLPLGILLTMTEKGHLKENKSIHEILGTLLNIGRSFPFAILMVALIPLTRAIVGTSLGTTASIVPLTIAAIPFFARLAYSYFKEVDKALVETAVVMGATTRQIVTKVLIPESLPSLVLGTTMMIINLIGYSTMAGTMGGGGLGKIAIQYGYQRFNTFLIVTTVIVLIILVQIIEWGGNRIARYLNRKRTRNLNQ